MAICMAIVSVIIGLQLSSRLTSPGGAIVLVTIGFFVLTTLVARLWPKRRQKLPVDDWKHQCTAPECKGAEEHK